MILIAAGLAHDLLERGLVGGCSMLNPSQAGARSTLRPVK